MQLCLPGGIYFSFLGVKTFSVKGQVLDPFTLVFPSVGSAKILGFTDSAPRANFLTKSELLKKRLLKISFSLNGSSSFRIKITKKKIK